MKTDDALHWYIFTDFVPRDICISQPLITVYCVLCMNRFGNSKEDLRFTIAILTI